MTDFHTHLFAGQDLGVDPDQSLLPDGVFRAVDTGSAGGHLIDAFRRLIIDKSQLEIKAFLNIASIGTTSIYLQGELKTPAYLDVDVAINKAREHSDIVIGIKVRASNDVGGDNAENALKKARTAADKLGLPLMVHLGPAPCSIETILENLGSGDFLTHSYTGWEGNTLVDSGKPRKSVVNAIKKGVIFDVGHGAGGFDSTVASTMIENDLYPDSISTDIHTGSIKKVESLTNVMSKFLALGMNLEEILIRTTSNPEKFGQLSRSENTLTEGSVANLAIFENVEGNFDFSDVHGHSFKGNNKIKPVIIIRNGSLIFNSIEKSEDAAL